MNMDIGKHLESQVKEKCGNRIVKVILERIQVSGQKPTNKSNETYSSLKISHENQDGEFRGARLSIQSGPGSGRPLRNKTKIYTHFFPDGNESSDDDNNSGSGASGFDSKPQDTSDRKSESSPLNKNKTRSKPRTNSIKPSANLKTKYGERNPCIKMTCDICKINLMPCSVRKHYRRKHPNEKAPRIPSSPPKPRHRSTTITRKYRSDKVISCDFCPSSFTRSYMWRHLQIKHREHLSERDPHDPLRRVKCDLCPSVLRGTQMYMHKKLHHSQTEPEQVKTISCLQCDLCSSKFLSQKGLEYHILQVHVVDKPFECGICFKAFLTDTKLSEHVKRAHEDNNFSCKLCPTKSFQDSASLKEHIEAIHKGYSHSEHCESETNENNHLCPVCDTWFETHSDLAKHLKKPKTSPVMKCELCSEPVYTPCRLNLHRQKKHGDIPRAVDASGKVDRHEGIVESPETETPKQGPDLMEKIIKVPASAKNQVSTNKFSCVVCSAHFSRRCDLDLHELHEKHRRWKCPVCAKLVNKKSELKLHIESAHSDARPFHCTHEGCSKTFKARKVLRKHIATHDTNRAYCKLCSRYLTPEKFEAHVANFHIGKDTFKCDVCNSIWATQKMLKKHKVTHTDERPWPCQFCDATFKSKSDVKRHMNKCQLWSEDQRKKFAKIYSAAVLRSAKTPVGKKRDTSSRKNSTTIKSVKSPQTLAPESKENSTSVNDTSDVSSFNVTDLKLTKQEMDCVNCDDNSNVSEFPVESVVPVTFEQVPKQEIS